MLLLLLLAAASVAPTMQKPIGMPEAGVPLTLAEERAARLTDVQYELSFSIPQAPAEPIRATERVRFELRDASRDLALDFAGPAGARVTVGGRTIDVAAANEHIVVPASALRAGRNEIAITFTAGDAPLNRNPEFIYTLFVPARARLAFPCFDQPDIKATYKLALDIPAGWEAVANGAETSRRAAGERLNLEFAETRPLPTYLFAFAAGRFQVETAERHGRRFRMLHRETDREKVARNRDAVFDLHAAALKWLEDYTTIPYPWGKFDFVLVPSFQFGGMEHAGAIFYNASSLLLDPSATQNQKLGRASLIAHETSHMWFGDLVTMKWFNDVWMKEVFANFMAAKIVNPSFPEINHELRFLLAHYPAAYDVDRTRGTNAIRQQLDNLNEAGSLYGAIIYQKAPIVMRHLELMIGADSFRDGLRQYLRAHTFGNASWPDLIAVLDERTPRDLKTWSHAWVEEAGRPIVTTQVKNANGKAVVTFALKDPFPARGLEWSQDFDVEAAGPPASPRYVLPNARGIAYGDFVLDPASRTYLLAHLEDLPELARGAALVTLWEEMVDGRIRPAAMFDTLSRNLRVEPNELLVQRMLSYTQQAYWRWLPAAERRTRAAPLEALLRAGLDRAATQSLKSAWFAALRDVALTPPTLAWLERVWSKTESIAGLELAEPDYIALAQELAVRGRPRWREILDAQHQRIQNPDRKARFAFVRPALAADAATRDAFFNGLTDVNNRRREAWVLEAVGYLHHPLRAAASEKYIAPSLALLREIQRTGDIFFPKRWMDATLSGHGSASAARTVAEFEKSLPPDYPERLRRVILSSADDLFRVSRLAP
jgi:aminopeptidase N